MKICPKCGNNVEDKAVLCDKCGNCFEAESNTQFDSQNGDNKADCGRNKPKKKNTVMIVGIVAAVLIVSAIIGSIAQSVFN